MYRLTFLFSLLVTLTINAKTENSSELNLMNSEFVALELTQFEVESDIFSNIEDETLNVEDIEVVELEEEVELNFDTAKYLPEDFNALAGKNDIDWSKIELVELEEEIEIGFDTKAYLPKDFNPYKGMYNKKDVVVCLN